MLRLSNIISIQIYQESDASINNFDELYCTTLHNEGCQDKIDVYIDKIYEQY